MALCEVGETIHATFQSSIKKAHVKTVDFLKKYQDAPSAYGYKEVSWPYPDGTYEVVCFSPNHVHAMCLMYYAKSYKECDPWLIYFTKQLVSCANVRLRAGGHIWFGGFRACFPLGVCTTWHLC
jgi:hypothetical protein